MAACLTAASIKFTVRRRPAVLVAPASPTPRELKRLSDLDDQDKLRRHIPVIHFYERKDQSMAMAGKGKGKDPPWSSGTPSLGLLYVPYYPFAGRLREHDGGKLAVDCTAEGVLFVEADADVRLDDFGDDALALLPPFPCVEELIFDVPGSSAILGTPLLLIQVTRLACGGFVMAVRQNHTMADAQGITQFLSAVAELAREAPLTVQPVWERHLLEGRRNSPQLRGDESLDDDDSSSSSSSMLLQLQSLDNMRLRSFFFGPDEIATIRAQLSSSPDLQKGASRFDVIAGWLWKHRTMALAPDSNEPMLMTFPVDARGRRTGIPAGYYGNAFALPVAVSTAGELCANPVSYAVRLVKEAKGKVDMEYMRSAADLIVLRRGRRRRPRIIPGGFYSLSDQSKARFDDLDFGWGKPVYGGPADAVGVPALPWMSSFVFKKKGNGEDDDGAVVPVCLPRPAMDRLVDEMGKLRRRHSPSPADVVTTLQQPLAVVKRSAL